MAIVLFAIIGAKLKLGVAYWICYGFFCSFKLAIAAGKFFKATKGDSTDEQT